VRLSVPPPTSSTVRVTVTVNPSVPGLEHLAPAPAGSSEVCGPRSGRSRGWVRSLWLAETAVARGMPYSVTVTEVEVWAVLTRIAPSVLLVNFTSRTG
jgi:hypothetical protein